MEELVALESMQTKLEIYMAVARLLLLGQILILMLLLLLLYYYYYNFRRRILRRATYKMIQALFWLRCSQQHKNDRLRCYSFWKYYVEEQSRYSSRTKLQ